MNLRKFGTSETDLRFDIDHLEPSDFEPGSALTTLDQVDFPLVILNDSQYD